MYKRQVQSGDYILAVNGCQINTKEELIRCVQEIQDKIMILKLKRGDETLRVRLQAVETEEGLSLIHISSVCARC